MSTPRSLKIATWNINSVRARLARLTAWLGRHAPDVLFLQETKVTDEAFPHAIIQAAGYNAFIFGQPTYNGVALLARQDLSEIQTGFDEEARMIAATHQGVRLVNVYVPNGQAVGEDKHTYKLAWFEKLYAFLSSELRTHSRLILCGDFNVAPQDLDAAHPDKWRGSVLCDAASRAALGRLRELGLIDVTRKLYPREAGLYTWWNYRTRGFATNDGLRIDHVYASPEQAALSVSTWVDTEERTGDKPSDHAPLLARFDA